MSSKNKGETDAWPGGPVGAVAFAYAFREKPEWSFVHSQLNLLA